MVRECDGDGAGARADVEDTEWRILVQLCQDGFNEVFGLGAGNKDGWGDAEGEAVELLFSGDVLDGFAGEAAEDEGFVPRLLAGREETGGVGVQRCAGDTDGVKEEPERIAGCIGAQVIVRDELGCGSGESFAEGEGSCRSGPR
jgi:hypothetical protein